jgi:hypothetical protein
MLGQGRDVLVAITTNEDLTRLHPAVVRPGRCLARLEIGRLTQAEATAWLAGADSSYAIGPGGLRSPSWSRRARASGGPPGRTRRTRRLPAFTCRWGEK